MERLSNALDWSMRRVLLVLMALEAAIVIVAVIARYVFNNSFPWSEELARAILTWIVFLGAASALKQNELVAMESARDAISDRKVFVTRVLTEVVLIAFLVALVYASSRLIGLTHRQTYPVTGYPLWVAYLAIPFSSALMILHSVTRVMRLLRGTEPLRQEFAIDEIA